MGPLLNSEVHHLVRGPPMGRVYNNISYRYSCRQSEKQVTQERCLSFFFYMCNMMPVACGVSVSDDGFIVSE